MNKQLQLASAGAKFQIIEAKKPTPEAGEVIIKLKAVALNPVDWKRWDSGSAIPSWPTILGIEGSGVVDAVGEGVTRFQKGDEVFTLCAGQKEGRRDAAFQEYTAVSEASAARKPASLSFEEVAGIGICFWTALAAVHLGLEVPIPWTPATNNGTIDNLQSVLVLGGSSVVGAYAITQLRRFLPETTQILTTCSPHNHALAKSLGASEAFDAKASDLLDQIRSASITGIGVSAILDAVNGAAIRPDILNVLDPAGPKKLVEVPSGGNLKPEMIPADVTADKVGVFALIGKMAKASDEGMTPLMKAFEERLEQGEFRMPVKVEVVGTGLEAVEAGLLRLKAGVSACKLVVTL